MKRNAIILAALLMLALCVLAYSLIARPFTSHAPSSNLAAVPAIPVAGHEGGSPTQPPETEGKARLPDSPLATGSSADTPQRSNDQLNMESLVKELIGATAADQEGELVTKPEQCVLLGIPYRLAFLEKENLLLTINVGGVYAFDIAFGGLIWHRYLESPSGQLGATFGRRQVLGWLDQAVFLLDATTGREDWSRRDDQCGPMETARLSADETQVAVTCKQGCILYSVADRTQRVLPKPANAVLCDWLPGNKTLLFAQMKGPGDYTIRNLLLMDTDSGVATPGWELRSSWSNMFPMLSALGQFAEVAADGDSNTSLTIRDARTGTVLREFRGIPGRSYFFWLRDARRLFSMTADRKQARVVDAETGMVQFSLSRDGHRFQMYKPFEDASDNAWIFSQDEANNRYVWPLTPDGAPRKVLDGGRIAAGSFQLYVSDQWYVLTTCLVEDQLWTHTAYTIEDLQKVAEWRVRVREQGWSFGPMVNQTMTHCVRFCPVGKDDQNRPQNMAFSVYVQDKETPVRTGRGRPIAVSPDAEYLAVQTDDVTSCVYDTKTDKIAGQFSAPARKNNYIYLTAAFSDDGNRVVLNTTQSLEVMDLTEGYLQWSMATGENNRFRGGRPCLSPDGTRVLCGGYGCAGLFDADTGALLHTFEETERFAQTYGYRAGFWNGLAAIARDWAGAVTDTFKPSGSVEAAFADGGARVITHAVGQVIRVWDADSGKLLHTIHTGLPEKRNKDDYIDNRIVLSATGRFAFCYNGNNFGIASLWSLADGALQRRYQLPERENAWPQAAPTDDGTAVYIKSNGNLYRWPGAPRRED